MPRLGSQLKTFLKDALDSKKYPNLYYSKNSNDTFCLHCPRKDSREYCLENIRIFQHYDTIRKHKFEYTKSRQRFESALKRSAYLTMVSSGKDFYKFRFNTAQEIAAKKAKDKRLNARKYKCGSDGESQQSSSESSEYSPLPWDTQSPVSSPMSGTSASGVDDMTTESPSTACSSDLNKIIEEAFYDQVDFSSLPQDLDDMFSVYLKNNDSEMEEMHDEIIEDFSENPVECVNEHTEASISDDAKFQHDASVDQSFKNQPTVGELPVLDASATQKETDLKIKAIQAALKLIPSIPDLKVAGNTGVSFLIDNCYLVTLRRPPSVA